MHLIMSHRLLYVQVPQVVTDSIFPYSARDFSFPIPILESIHSRAVGREASSKDRDKEVVEYLSLLLVHCYQFACLAPQGQG